MALDLKDIKKIIELMEKHELSLFNLQKEDFRLKLKKGANSDDIKIIKEKINSQGSYAIPHMAPIIAGGGQHLQHSQSLQNPSENQSDGEGQQKEQYEDKNKEKESFLKEFTSPMVGTFYRSLKPGAEEFVKPGVKVQPGQTLCIIEAMKVMNEIKADESFIVEEIVVEDSTPVQYGEVLFKYKK